MSIKRNYRLVCVKDISLEVLCETALTKGGTGTCVGLDVAKDEIVSVVRWPDETFERPWKIENPVEIDELLQRLLLLKENCDSLTIGLESTGTYSESVRYAMTAAGLEVHRVSGKAVSDYKEIFDGVPSQHDGKDAAMIAELTCYGKGTPWPYQPLSENEQAIRHQVARLAAYRTQTNQWLGRVEGILARHWPELTGYLRLGSATLLNICSDYSSPAAVAASDASRQQLRSWGRGQLAWSKIDAIIESARTTSGVPIGESEMFWLKELAGQAIAGLAAVNSAEKELRKLAEEHESMKPYVQAVGAVTLCTIWATVGDPRQYSSSGAFLKALGLNLKELSSGKRKGELAITKRGPSLARKLLFYWALRGVQHPRLKGWYRQFQRVGKSTGGNSEHRKMKGLVAMMRKLCKSLWYVYHRGEEFDYAKVFPGEPLQKRRKRARRKSVVSN